MINRFFIIKCKFFRFVECNCNFKKSRYNHSLFIKTILSAFPIITPERVINELKRLITQQDSITFTSFSHCFKNLSGDIQDFKKDKITVRTT